MIENLKFDDAGLIPVIVQDYYSKKGPDFGLYE